MAEENADRVRLAYEVAYVNRSVEGVRDRFAPDFIWHSRAEWPGKKSYGVDEMPELWADLDDTFSEFELIPTAYEEVSPSHVLVTVRQGFRLRGGESRVEITLWHLWLVEGLPREAWVFADRASALAAAGLSE
jgi:hypothetical protein